MSVEIVTSDILEWISRYQGEPFHAVLCDPPYHLTSIVNRFKNGEPEHTKTAADIRMRRTPHARQAAGFMGQQWDGGDIAFRPETWQAIAPILHPGAFIMAFAGTRGYHRMACAMEDAGLVIHPALGWLFLNGFPKATRVKAGEWEVSDEVRQGAASQSIEAQMGLATSCFAKRPLDAMARAWEGHRYGLQALKPSFEFIAVAQKPYKGRPLDCITKTGAGALNVDKGRVGTSADAPQTQGVYRGSSVGIVPDREEGKQYAEGRWPANFCVSEDAEHLLNAGYDGFFCPDWQAEMMERLAGICPVLYEPKASTGERDRGTRAPAAIPQGTDTELELVDGGRGTSGVYSARRDGSLDGNITAPRNNVHPTVKPVSLAKWLAGLLLPPKEYAPRRILVPFAGSGSECAGAFLAGWDEVVGVELSEQYASIARQRLTYWQVNIGLYEDAVASDVKPEQFSMELG